MSIAKLALLPPVIRGEPFQLRLRIGIDLTGATIAFFIGHPSDPAEGPVNFTTPGATLLTLSATATEGADGCRFIGFADGYSTVEILAATATVAALPATPSGRDRLRLSYALRVTMPTVSGGFTEQPQTWIYGDLWLAETAG